MLPQSLQQSAPVSQPSGLDGIDQEASGQLPPGAKAAAGSYHSDNPFVEEAPFGSNTSAPAGDTSVLILRPLKGARNDKRAVSRRPSDEESQLLSDSEAAGPSTPVYITATAGAPEADSAPSAQHTRHNDDESADDSADARLLGPKHPRVPSWGAEGESTEEGTVRGTGNPFASFLGNPFGLGRTLSRHFGSFRAAGGWPSVGAFSALKVNHAHDNTRQASALDTWVKMAWKPHRANQASLHNITIRHIMLPQQIVLQLAFGVSCRGVDHALPIERVALHQLAVTCINLLQWEFAVPGEILRDENTFGG